MQVNFPRNTGEFVYKAATPLGGFCYPWGIRATRLDDIPAAAAQNLPNSWKGTRCR